MIAVDTNLLVYAHRPECPLHDEARSCIAGLAESGRPFGIPIHCLVEFSGVVTHPKIWKQPSSCREVADQVSAWTEAPSLRLLAEEPPFWPLFLETVAAAKVTAGAVHDARIAAACRYHGVTELWTADRDFSRFVWLRVRNPLVAPP